MSVQLKVKSKIIILPDTACGESAGVEGDGGKVLPFGSEGYICPKMCSGFNKYFRYAMQFHKNGIV